MQPFTRLESCAIVLRRNNVDTDQIVPARFLRTPRAQGYATFLFHDLRQGADGQPDPDFVLNQPASQGAQILVSGENFGCGSSREGAVYALADSGIRCVIAPSFGDIFRNNCYKNGVLPIVLATADVEALVAAGPATRLVVDLAAQSVSNTSRAFAFDIAPFWKRCLLAGLDDIELTLQSQARITAFARQRLAAFPWLVISR